MITNYDLSQHFVDNKGNNPGNLWGPTIELGAPVHSSGVITKNSIPVTFNGQLLTLVVANNKRQSKNYIYFNSSPLTFNNSFLTLNYKVLTQDA